MGDAATDSPGEAPSEATSEGNPDSASDAPSTDGALTCPNDNCASLGSGEGYGYACCPTLDGGPSCFAVLNAGQSPCPSLSSCGSLDTSQNCGACGHSVSPPARTPGAGGGRVSRDESEARHNVRPDSLPVPPSAMD